jgi:uncharacterized protein YqeY
MSLKARFDQDLTVAMKSKDALRTSVLRMVKSAIRLKEVEKTGAALDDDQVLQVMGNLIKQRRDSIEKYTAANRPELVQKEQDEIAIIQEYLPAALSQDEIAAGVAAAIAETGAAGPKDFGKAMKAAMARFKGRNVDGKVVSDLMKERLG